MPQLSSRPSSAAAAVITIDEANSQGIENRW
jgi:hypothetical protein